MRHPFTGHSRLVLTNDIIAEDSIFSLDLELRTRNMLELSLLLDYITNDEEKSSKSTHFADLNKLLIGTKLDNFCY